MHSFEVHSNESACRKSGRLGLEQVAKEVTRLRLDYFNQLSFPSLPHGKWWHENLLFSCAFFA